jgi:hypothetical protein
MAVPPLLLTVAALMAQFSPVPQEVVYLPVAFRPSKDPACLEGLAINNTGRSVHQIYAAVRDASGSTVRSLIRFQALRPKERAVFLHCPLQGTLIHVEAAPLPPGLEPSPSPSPAPRLS